MVRPPREIKVIIKKMLTAEQHKKVVRIEKAFVQKNNKSVSEYANLCKQISVIERKKSALSDRIGLISAERFNINCALQKKFDKLGMNFFNLDEMSKGNFASRPHYMVTDTEVNESTDLIYARLLLLNDESKWEAEIVRLIKTVI